MKGLFIPDITAEMFRNGCLESIEALMAEGEIYDIDYSLWVPVSERLPEVDEDGYSDYILISLENFSLPVIGQYVIDQDGDGSFHEGDEERTLLSYGLFVNAWMPLPKPYRESE